MKINVTYSYQHNGCEVVLVVEDDMITSAKVYGSNGNCINVFDVGGEDGLPNNRKSVNTILEQVYAEIDK